jgi:NADH:ubiquinone oxidoreductase subunit F (NADH-binding)
MRDIIKELKKYNILGRSGSGFPTASKWEIVKKQKSDKKYIICNASEGEPQNLKDGYILKYHLEEAINGVKVALKTIDNSSAFIYLRKDYYWWFSKKIKKLCEGYPITILKKKGGYLAGEETTLCEAIEGKRAEPRMKPPYPVYSGLWGKPTLVNNIETFYCVGKISKEEYNNERFFTVTGDIGKRGVFKLSKDLTIKEVLEKTDNYPDFDFFVQAGGGAMGEILLPEELDRQIQGIGCIIVYDRRRTDCFKLMKKWAKFFSKENCDKCVPCREGVYRINELLNKKQLDKKILEDIFFAMEKTSYCPLGKNIPKAFKTLIDKIV